MRIVREASLDRVHMFPAHERGVQHHIATQRCIVRVGRTRKKNRSSEIAAAQGIHHRHTLRRDTHITRGGAPTLCSFQ